MINIDYDVKASSVAVCGSYALYSNTKKIELIATHPDLMLMALVFDD